MKKSKIAFGYMQLGLQIAVSVLLGFYIGYKMDIRFNTSPVFLLLGCVFGIAAGFYLFFKEINKNGK